MSFPTKIKALLYFCTYLHLDNGEVFSLLSRRQIVKTLSSQLETKKLISIVDWQLHNKEDYVVCKVYPTKIKNRQSMSDLEKIASLDLIVPSSRVVYITTYNGEIEIIDN